MFSYRVASLQGETPLLDASMKLVQAQSSNATEREDAYLKVVITLINFGGDIFVHDRRGRAPEHELRRYARAKDREFPQDAKQQDLIEFLQRLSIKDSTQDRSLSL